MTFNEMLTRSLKKATKSVRDFNGGALKVMGVEFKFQFKGKRFSYALKIQYSPSPLAAIGYGEKYNEVTLWERQNSSTLELVELLDYPPFNQEIEKLKQELEDLFTYEQIQDVLKTYLKAAKEF